jgi:hypothetical protein
MHRWNLRCHLQRQPAHYQVAGGQSAIIEDRGSGVHILDICALFVNCEISSPLTLRILFLSLAQFCVKKALQTGEL